MSLSEFRQARYNERLLFEYALDKQNTGQEVVPANLRRRTPLRLPKLTEPELIRHYTRLSQMSFGVDTGFYPLGSCTMKYTPRLTNELAELAADIHPYQHEETIQGCLQLMYELQQMLCTICDMDAFSLQPAAGAQGELAGMLIARAYHEMRGEQRTEIILPDTAHGTNPASAAMAGFDVVEIPSKNGCVDLNALRTAVSERTAAFMLTNPNTLGLFEKEICEIASTVHEAGALLYYDGANLNAILGMTSPGKMGFDIVHLNLHKTFGAPHGGGGPGAGPVGVKTALADFLPVPIVGFDGKKYFLDYSLKHTIGKLKHFYGNFNVLLRAYIYIKLLGGDGLKRASTRAVLNANYLKSKLADKLGLPFKTICKHEFVLSGKTLREKGLRTLDIAKRMLDFGCHAPTIYFPQLVDEALMIEPTETESKPELDRFAAIVEQILSEPVEKLRLAPSNTAVGRVDEVAAAKNLIFNCNFILTTNTK